MLTSYMVASYSKGGKSKGLMVEPKHYAFNHQEANRSGVSTFFTEQSGRENELRGFQMAMQNNYAQGVMTAFNRIGTVFAGAHEGALIQIAREEWGYEGWIVTDMINGADYMNWRDTTAAGGGNMLTETAYENAEIGTMAASKDLIAKDTYFQEMMKYNIKFWLYQLVQSNAMNGLTSNTEIQYVTTWWQNALSAAVTVTAILTVLSLAMYAVVSVKPAKKKD